MGDQPHARAGRADRLDPVLVARTVEHNHHHVADRGPLALGHQPHRLPQGAVQVEQVGDLGRAGHLLHVHARAGIEHRPPRRQRDHRQCARHPVGGERRALERVDRDVHLRGRAVTDVLAVVEHRCFVLLPLADHDHAVHAHRVQHVAHAVDRRLVGRLLVAHPHQRRSGQRRGLGHADELQGQVAVGLLLRLVSAQRFLGELIFARDGRAHARRAARRPRPGRRA